MKNYYDPRWFSSSKNGYDEISGAFWTRPNFFQGHFMDGNAIKGLTGAPITNLEFMLGGD